MASLNLISLDTLKCRKIVMMDAHLFELNDLATAIWSVCTSLGFYSTAWQLAKIDKHFIPFILFSLLMLPFLALYFVFPAPYLFLFQLQVSLFTSPQIYMSHPCLSLYSCILTLIPCPAVAISTLGTFKMFYATFGCELNSNLMLWQKKNKSIWQLLQSSTQSFDLQALSGIKVSAYF